MSRLEHVRAGDPLRIPAGDYNAMIETARAHAMRGGAMSGVMPASNTPLQPVWIQPDVDVGRYHVLKVAGVVFEPSGSSPTSDANLAFQRQVLFAGTTPDDDPYATYVITLEPGKANTPVRCTLEGAIPCRVNLNNSGHHYYAAPRPGYTDQLITRTAGPYRILYRPEAFAIQWCVVQHETMKPFWGAVTDTGDVAAPDRLGVQCLDDAGEVISHIPINVAKPPLLRHDVAHYPNIDTLTSVNDGSGNRVDVTASSPSGDLEERWVVTPPYVGGSSFPVPSRMILVQPVPWTGVMTTGANPQPIRFVDANVDGRQWMVEL